MQSLVLTDQFKARNIYFTELTSYRYKRCCFFFSKSDRTWGKKKARAQRENSFALISLIFQVLLSTGGIYTIKFNVSLEIHKILQRSFSSSFSKFEKFED